ncbi:carbonic anhydrase [Sphingomonas rhizophila]|uniref:Carbonic anhydrase n=1 Tax=Sphingomonas rhizophila TaxID=2071607 RepID=A0A7G9SDF9_9SPHN|nr:carbonic anhydrase [Sphingomonas rhizophila]QNN65884.1 carbonic anhydrase [Sphingomonas rhizophila]
MEGFGDLLAGYRRFRTNSYAGETAKWRELAEGQSPRACIIACSDSRVDPAIIFDTDPGEIFVVRNVANLVPPFEADGGRHGVSAALEFAVTQLDVPEVLVIGHERCGGIHAALSGVFNEAPEGEGGFVARWMEQIEGPAQEIANSYGVNAVGARKLEEAAIRQSLINLRTFPFIAEREEAGVMKLVGCHFSIGEGQLYMLDEAEGDFRPV